MFSASKTAGASGSSGYNINNSLRFRASASAYLSRTPSVAGNRQTWTWSGWVKRGSLQTSSRQTIFSASDGTLQNYTEISFDTNSIRLLNYTANVKDLDRTSTSVYRDPSAWYHIVLAFDTTQAVATNRQRVYVNGVEVTAWTNTAQMAQNANGWVSSTQPHRIALLNGFTSYFDGYLANVDFIDGQALTPSSFGETSSTTGVWIPKKYTGSYGTNGFYLNFSNGTSTTTLGYDSSGNGNNWTTNNISLTSGSTYDWMLDSPTPFDGTSYGVGNYSVFSPLGNGSGAAASSGLTNGNLTVSGAITGGFQGTFGLTAGKWYWEVTAQTIAAPFIGVCNDSRSLTADPGITLANEYGFYCNPGINYMDGSSNPWTSGTASNGDIIGVAIDATDLANVKIWLSKNNVWYSSGGGTSGNPSAGTNQIQTITGGKTLYPCCMIRGAAGSSTLQANFGQRPFAYTPPSGYKSLCTQNLPGVTIQNGAQYMAATTYTGNGSTQTISGAAFQPDLVWVKCRSVANNHVLYDSVRGAGSGKALSSCLTAQEGLGTTDADSKYGYVSSLNSNGFSVAGGSLGQQYVNTNAATYIGWQWKAGGTAVTNTAGTITSSVSANPTAGFSVVTWTCNNTANQSIGHGLGVAPSLVIVKDRDQGSSFNWNVWFTGFTANEYLQLNTTIAKASYSTLWYTVPDSTKIYIGTAGTAVNNATDKMVAYCFASIPGYSAFGSYTGNGSADGPFVFTGMRPRWIMVKRTDVAEVWAALDTSRNPYNIVNEALFSNTSDATYTFNYIDILSNGFKVKNTGTGTNASGGTYIYAAFAENPFQNALAR